ncbi:hypothetical protein BFW90_17445 [Pseudomonas fluorescens]|nr:hypothetical protein BFW90_17445 [Pseudomonas fluorescens]
MLAKIANENAAPLVKRGVLRFFASKLAPTVVGVSLDLFPRIHPCSKSTSTSTAPSSRSLSAPQKGQRPSA